MKNRKVVFKFRSRSAFGAVTISRDFYGVAFSVAARGVKYKGFLDLYHLAATDNKERFLQVVVDGIGDRAETAHFRVFPNGTTATLAF